MKRFLAMALATAMTMSMASVAFAATTLRIPVNGNVAGDSSYGPVATWQACKWDDEEDNKFVTPNNGSVYAPGDTIYYPLVGNVYDGNNGDTPVKAPVFESDAVKNLRIKATWDMGKDAISGVTLTKKKIDSAAFASTWNLDAASLTGARSYAYFIAVNTKSTMKKSVDVSGRIELDKSATKNTAVTSPNGTAGNYGDEIDEFVFYVDAEIKYEENGVAGASDWIVGEDRQTFKFDGEEEEQEIYLVNEDTASFTVDTRGQGSIILSANNDFNAAISAKYPNANLDFITVEASDSFNRIGTLRVYAEEGQYLYALDSNGNITNAKATYDEADECYVMRTRTLGSFVLSDTELDVKAPEVDTPSVEVPEVKPDNNKPFNPGTGAAC